MSVALAFTHTLQTVTCYKCGIQFAMPAYFKEKRMQDGQCFFCPNGHSQAYTETEVQRLQKELELERRRTEFQKSQRQLTERQLIASKGQMTKLRNRVGNGVCPCCNRSFTNLRRHITTQHPEWKEQKTA